MLQGLNLALPSRVQHAPNANALKKTAILVVGGQELATPPIAQEYFEPGVNTKLNRRTKPKANYTLPSDMPKYPLGFVPVNQTPGANGEEPAIVPQKELVPQDLLQVFQKVAAERLAETKPVVKVDEGTRVSRELLTAVREVGEVRKADEMMRKGFTAEETTKAMDKAREERALVEAKTPAKGASVEEAIAGMVKLGEPPERSVKVPEGQRAVLVSEKIAAKLQKLEQRAKKGATLQELLSKVKPEEKATA